MSSSLRDKSLKIQLLLTRYVKNKAEIQFTSENINPHFTPQQ